MDRLKIDFPNWESCPKDLLKVINLEQYKELFSSRNLKYTARYFRNKELINWAIDNGFNNWQDIAEASAKGGYLDLVKMAIITEELDINWVACAAARHGRMDIVGYLVEIGADDIDQIAISATKGAYINIIIYLSNKAQLKWDKIAEVALAKGYPHIARLADRIYLEELEIIERITEL
jgi:hypothetical protein